MAALIDDAYDTYDLPDRWTTALEFTDHFLRAPGPIPAPLGDKLAAHFDAAAYVELALGLGLFHGFSKMLIALGLEPDQMDTTVLPTPTASGTTVDPADPANPLTSLLADRPDLAARWHHMVASLDALHSLDASIVRCCRDRLATLLGGVRSGPDELVAVDDALATAAIELSELFVIDVRAIGDDHLRRISDQVGQRGLVQLVMNLAVFDGIHRFASCVPGSPLAPVST